MRTSGTTVVRDATRKINRVIRHAPGPLALPRGRDEPGGVTGGGCVTESPLSAGPSVAPAPILDQPTGPRRAERPQEGARGRYGSARSASCRSSRLSAVGNSSGR